MDSRRSWLISRTSESRTPQCIFNNIAPKSINVYRNEMQTQFCNENSFNCWTRNSVYREWKRWTTFSEICAIVVLKLAIMKGRNPEYRSTVLANTTKYVTRTALHCFWAVLAFSFFISLFPVFGLSLPLILLFLHSFLSSFFFLQVTVLTSLTTDLIFSHLW